MDTTDTGTLVLKLISSTTMYFDKLSEYACAVTPQHACYQAETAQNHVHTVQHPTQIMLKT